ncbi:NAD(P)-binding domain-containing protein [Aquimarina sp. Aq107]|uniref:NAD(P)-binding domain-containing protein n=1 Tax=Aquimarina sp. Aq107 TaxID=1191912 RepID=UPI000D54B318|nr:NAD(P)-binding domain-containing protein [Aquimarina sp. Aq107]
MRKQIIIIGAGPGGIQLAYYLEKNNIDYLVLERNDKSGSFYEKFPIHKKLISINKVHTGFEDPEVNMRFDWNSLLSDDNEVLFKDFSEEYFPSSDSFVEYINKYSEYHNLNIKYNSEVKQIRKSDHFEIETNDETYQCEHLVIATGLSKPYMPNIENIDLCTNYVDLEFDPKPYTGKRILILGKANSAFETADHLIPYATLIHCLSPNPLKLAWGTHYVGHLRAVNNNFLDTYQLKSQNAVINGEIESIKFENNQYYVTVAYGNANGEVEELIYDEIINCTGFKFDTSMFHDSIKPELSNRDKFPKQNSSWESVNIENLYFAGTITQMRDYKKSTSGFIHGFRYNSKCLYHILDNKINDKEWVYESEELVSPESMAQKIIDNVNRASSLWQQFGYIGHVIVLTDEGTLKYFYDVPVDYLHDNYSLFGSRYFVITLEYGDEIFKNASDIFAVERVHKDDVDNAHLSAFLHPIVREYYQGELVTTHHIIEDFESKWDEYDTHVLPLIKYLEGKFVTLKSELLK